MGTETCQGGKVLTTIEKNNQTFTLIQCCMGKTAVDCACPGRWPQLLDFVAVSLKKPEDARLRYFQPVKDVKAQEQLLRPQYVAVLLALTEQGDIAAACWLARNMVRMKGVGKKPTLADTATVDAAFITAARFRGWGLATALAHEAVAWLRATCIGLELEIRTDFTNVPMVRAMRTLGSVKRDTEEQCYITRVALRKPTAVDTRTSIAAIQVGFLLTMALVPLVMLVTQLDKLHGRARLAKAA